MGSNKLLPRLQQMLDGFRKVDPPTTKQLPVEADILEFLVKLGLDPEARELDCAVRDLTMTVCYYLLCIGEYTTKGTQNNSKQIEEFKLGDITFFAKDKHSNLRCLPCDAPSDLITSAKDATMKLDNQRMGGREYMSIRKLSVTPFTPLSGRWADSIPTSVSMGPPIEP